MEQIFDAILGTSLSGGVIILVILGLRLVLKNTPKRFICLLWLLAMARLLIPFSIESPLSLQPDPDRLSALQPEHSVTQEEIPADPMVPAEPVVTPDVTAPVQQPSVTLPGSSSVLDYDVVIGNTVMEHPDMVIIDTTAIYAQVWAAVACGFLVYTAVSYLLLRRKVRDAVQVDEGIYECASIDSPFLLGYFRTRIYLPVGLPLQDLDHILAHEQAHIRRLDNWTKLAMFVCLALHWFNPLVWTAYILLCRDMEMACDEQVVRNMSAADRKAYSGALLNCAAGHRLVSACPVAFGEVSVKQRILKVLNYRKPAFWISIITIVAIVFVAVCFLTSPSPDKAALLEQCRTALEEFQSTGCYQTFSSINGHIIWWNILDVPKGSEELMGHRREYLLITDSAESSMYRLYLNGQYLQRDVTYGEDGENTDSGWYSTDWSGSSSFSAYTDADLNWEAFTSITVIGSRQERVIRDVLSNIRVDATIVTLRMEDENRDYEYNFYLDEAGKLFRINSTDLLSNDRESVLAAIDRHAQEAAADLQVYLPQCVQALQELFEADTFYMDTFSKQIAGPSLIWIRDGANQFLSRSEDRVMTTVLEYGGSCFRRDKTYYGGYLIGDSRWYPTEDGISQEDYPWFLTMDWENSGAYVLEAAVTDNDQAITVRVPEQENVLQFLFDMETGELDSIYHNGLVYSFADAETARSHLELHYRLASGLTTEQESPATQKCRKAIEFLQTGSYTIIQSETIGKQGYARLQGFKVGDDLLIHYTGTEQSYLRLDCKDYARNADGWTETDLGDFSGVAEWIIDDLQWDPDRCFVQYDIGDITVAVADGSLPQGFYLLVFSFDETGKLTSLTHSYDTGSPGDWTTHTTIITVRHPDPESTAAYIQRYFEETQE